mmetsp:Transcript_23391/g.53982  ORF Transcript_23391/g.53982 Transcript_23391/m.53982 type:complete len:275 (-) Transcript_23391:33-857(-)
MSALQDEVDSPDDSSLTTPTSRGAEERALDPSLASYALSLGIDVALDQDLLWLAQEAYNAPLPAGWIEYTSEQGQLYYCRQEFGETTWEHPMDQVYREAVSLVLKAREEQIHPEQCMDFIKRHLQEVRERAMRSLQGWSGPYQSEQGEYYHHDILKVSSWDNPVAEWESELRVRYNVLARGLPQVYTSPSTASGSDLLGAFKLPLELCCRGDIPDEPSTTRSSYNTARSHQSTARHSARSELSRPSQSPPGHRRRAKDPKDMVQVQEDEVASGT